MSLRVTLGASTGASHPPSQRGGEARVWGMPAGIKAGGNPEGSSRAVAARPRTRRARASGGRRPAGAPAFQRRPPAPASGLRGRHASAASAGHRVPVLPGEPWVWAGQGTLTRLLSEEADPGRRALTARPASKSLEDPSGRGEGGRAVRRWGETRGPFRTG